MPNAQSPCSVTARTQRLVSAIRSGLNSGVKNRDDEGGQAKPGETSKQWHRENEVPQYGS